MFSLPILNYFNTFKSLLYQELMEGMRLWGNNKRKLLLIPLQLPVDSSNGSTCHPCCDLVAFLWRKQWHPIRAFQLLNWQHPEIHAKGSPMEIMTEPLGSMWKSDLLAKSTEINCQWGLAPMTALALSMKDSTLALENKMECQAQLDIPTHSCRVTILMVRLNNEKKEKR